MAWLPMYLEKEDLDLVLNYLNEDSEIAFIIKDGEKRWKAVDNFKYEKDGDFMLWHKPGGPLPYYTQANKMDKPIKDFIEDPYAGWEERFRDEAKIPYFGPGYPATMTFDIRLKGSKVNSQGIIDGVTDEVIGMTTFGWIGNHYRIIGLAADNSTEKWWKKLRRWVSKNATKITRDDAYAPTATEIWAFPAALKNIQSGKKRDGNPYIF